MSSSWDGPVAGYAGGTVYRPEAAANPPQRPQVRTFDASTTAPFVATLPTAGTASGRLLLRVYIAGPEGSTARLRVGQPVRHITDPRATRDGTSSGVEDMSEYVAPGLYIGPGEDVSVVWDTAPGAFATFATFEFLEL